MPADGQHHNAKQSTTQPLVQKFSVGHGITKADNLKPLDIETIQQLEQLVSLYSTHITNLINPAHGVRTREDYDQLPESIRKQIKQSGHYFTSGLSATGGRTLSDMDSCGLALLDLDRGNVQVAEIQAHLSPWEFVAWESISSRIGNRKWRVALPLKGNLPVGSYRLSYERWCHQLPDRIKDNIDLSQGRPTQPALLPVLWDKPETLIFSNRDGMRLNLAKHLTSEEQLIDPAKAAFENYSPPIEGLTAERIRLVLKLLDPDPEDTWIRVGWGLHHQFGGDEEGLELWKEWAQASPKYNENDHDYKWNRMTDKPSRTLTTWNSIEGMARRAASATGLQEWERVIAKIDNADDLKMGVADGIIGDKRLTEEERKQLGSTLKKKAADLGDTTWTVAKWRQHITYRLADEEAAPVRESTPQPVDESADDTPPEPSIFDDDPSVPKERKLRHWKDEWVYLTEPDRYLFLPTGTLYKPEAVNNMLNRNLLNDKKRVIMPATQFLTNVIQIDIVFNVGYFPGRNARVIRSGNVWINTWTKESLPAGWNMKDEMANGLRLTARQRAGVVRFLRQVCYLLEPTDRRDFIRWVAWCVQNEGKKSRWSPLIYSVQGTGKTLLCKAIGETFGHDNWTSVDGHQVVTSNFTNWAEGRVFSVIEELKVMGSGASGFAVSNKLKPYISNDEITIDAKFLPSKVVPNITNYIALTNHYHPISVESAAERRWFMCASNLRANLNRDTFTKMHSRDGGRYFHRLAELSEDAELILGLRRWLWHYDLKGWTTQGTAPKTQWLRDVAEISSSGTAHGALPDLLTREWTGNDQLRNWFSLTCLRDHIRQQGYDGSHDPDKVLGHTSTVNTAIKEQGYAKFCRLKIDTQWHTIYVHQSAYSSHGWITTLQRNYGKDRWEEKAQRAIVKRYRELAATQGGDSATSDFSEGKKGDS